MPYRPTLDDFKALAPQGNLVPVYREIPADLETPVSAFMKLQGKGFSFLLESVERGEQLGRYSILGGDLALLLRVEGDRVLRRDASGLVEETRKGRDALSLLKQTMAAWRVAPLPELRGFVGGAVGYLGYDVVRDFEKLPDRGKPGLGLPDCMFVLTDKLVVFDHVRQKMQLVVLAHVEQASNAEAAYAKACADLDAQIVALRGPIPTLAHAVGNGTPQMRSNFTRDEFMAGVEQIKEHIRAGDAFQVVLSQRLSRPTSAHPMAIYRALRMLNPSPYMFFLDMDEFQLIGSSPEMLVKLNDGVAETRPIAGTRPRGADDDDDRRLSDELLADPKERAEHIMLVDLGRNDLGRVCQYGTVRVPTFMDVEKYSHVMHIVSSVKGKIDARYDLFDVTRACFPAGTVTGAPKIRAMQIIEELEPTRRGAYAGAVGYFGFGGSLNTCITIRTLVMRDGEVHFQAGAGIVADSDAAREYQETLDKIAALRGAVEMAEKGLE